MQLFTHHIWYIFSHQMHMLLFKSISQNSIDFPPKLAFQKFWVKQKRFEINIFSLQK